MVNIWNKEKASRAGQVLIKAALAAGGSLTYSQGWEKVRARKNKGIKGIVTGIIGSYATYDKIVKGLLDRGTFIRDSDPKDKRVTILRLQDADQAKAELQFQEAFDQIKGLMEQPSFPIPRQQWSGHYARAMESMEQGPPLSAKEEKAVWKHPYVIQQQKVTDLVKISHALYFKMEDDPRLEGAFISPHGDAFVILPRESYDFVKHRDRMLRRILEEGKKDQDKEMWLKRLGAYEPWGTSKEH